MAYDLYVYILASKSGVLYVGFTNNLEFRVWQHKTKQTPGFTSRYNVDRLVWFEHHVYVNNAIAREKQIKSWAGRRRSSFSTPKIRRGRISLPTGRHTARSLGRQAFKSSSFNGGHLR